MLVADRSRASEHPTSSDTSEIARYSGSIGTSFQLRDDSGAESEIVLVRVDQPSESSRVGREGRAPFSLIFRGPNGRSFPQDVYHLDHPALGQSRLLLVPVGPPRDGAILEAVFG